MCAFEQVIDLRTGLPTSYEALAGEAAQTQLVLVGERHGTAEHAQLAGCLLQAKAGSRAPALALEHVPADRQGALDDWRRDNPFDADLFADAVDWEGLGWPDFFHYRPLIEAAGSVRAHLVATDRPRPGSTGGPALASLLAVAPEYGLQTADIVAAWVPDMISAHCDLIDEEPARRMAAAQMERDRIMAGRIIAGRSRAAQMLYFGGKGHVRRDRAIPYLLARTDRPPSMLVVAAFTTDEWDAIMARPDGTSGLDALYDLAVIAGTAERSDADMCEELRARMGVAQPSGG